MEVRKNQATTSYRLFSMCDPSYPTLDLSSMKDSFVLVSPNYPRPYPRGSGKYCSVNVTIGRGMQIHPALVDVDLVSLGIWPPLWKLRLLAYLSTSGSSAQEQFPVASDSYSNQTNYVVVTDTRNCSGEPDLLHITSSTYA